MVHEFLSWPVEGRELTRFKGAFANESAPAVHYTNAHKVDAVLGK